MLKKLVKYGNSTALVLDKAILELLGMSEGSIVKIRTDGTSLIITPQQPTTEQKVIETKTPEELMVEAGKHIQQAEMAKRYHIPPTAEDLETFNQTMGQLIIEYQPFITKLSENLDYQQELLLLQKKYAQSEPSFEQHQAQLKDQVELQKKYAPELTVYHEKLTALQKSFDEQFKVKQAAQQTNLSVLNEGFRTLFRNPKHMAAMQKFMALNNNPDYRHELMQLSEKYQQNHDSNEYLKEYLELRYKYIPEARIMDEEMKKIAKQEE